MPARLRLAVSPIAAARLRGLVRRARVAAVAALAAVGLVTPALAAPPEPVRLRLIGFNDFHGNLESGGLSLFLADPAAPGKTVRVPTGGAAALAGMIQRLRAGADHSLVVTAGDMVGAAPLVSTLFRHESTIEVMNRIGIDVNAAGNHEFDAGVIELRRLYAGGCAAPTAQQAITSCALQPYTGSKFPLLTANVLDTRGKPTFAPWAIRTFDGIPVGVIGVVTKTAPILVSPSGVAGLRFIDEAEAINRSARELKARGVKAIIAVLHEGGEIGPSNRRADWNDTTCPGATGPIFDIVKRTTRDVDAFFTGHTHQGYRCIVDGRVIIQAVSYGRGLSVVDVVLDRRTRDIDPARTESINLPVLNEHTEPELRERMAAATREPYAALLRVTRPDPEIAQRVAQYSAVVAPKAGQPVGRVAGRYTRSATASGPGLSDSAAGRLVADAQLAATRAPERGGAQVAFMNPGGIRTDLDCAAPPCQVSFGAVFSMQPFGNSLVVMTLTGAQIRALLESQQRSATGEPSFLQPSAGFTYRWLSKAPPGQRVEDMRLDGQPVVPTQRYRVAVNSFLAEGGDGFDVLLQGADRQGGGQDLDALIAHLKTEPPLAPQTEPRVRWVP
jgi:5'-nucleotidase